jgi:hypothetical protein
LFLEFDSTEFDDSLLGFFIHRLIIGIRVIVSMIILVPVWISGEILLGDLYRLPILLGDE